MNNVRSAVVLVNSDIFTWNKNRGETDVSAMPKHVIINHLAEVSVRSSRTNNFQHFYFCHTEYSNMPMAHYFKTQDEKYTLKING